MGEHSRKQTGRVRFGGVQTPRGYRFEMTGGRLCVDFANTLDERATDHQRELLPQYQRLLEWGVQAGALTRASAGVLGRHAARHQRMASSALRRAIGIREAIFDLLSAIARRRPVPGGALADLNRLIVQAAGRRRLERHGDRFVWAWRRAERPDLDWVLWPVAWSTGELMASPDLDRVRQCAGAGCAWLFIDTSKSGTRRWCDMTVCGNRAKARRFYTRAKKRGAARPR